MNEELLQYIWQAGLFNSDNLVTTEGRDVMILKRGRLNRDSGPDFSEARIRIGEADWVGNVEIHINSNDWYLHKHHTDKAYNNTVLHVVFNHQKSAVREDGSYVPTLIVNDRIYPHVLKHYSKLKASEQWVPCAPFITPIDNFTKTQAIDRALVGRLERKSSQINEWLQMVKNDWHSVFYFAITRSFGFGTNAIPFEQLAMRLPIQILGKHKNNQQQIEALVFGTAGFLEEIIDDEYHSALRKEWQFLKTKYNLTHLQYSSFKLMRMRPGNFPTMRLAQLSALIYKSHHLFAAITELNDVKAIIKLFEAEGSAYWTTHYVFGKTTRAHSTALSNQALELLLINAVVPVLFVYGRNSGNEALCNKAISILQHLSPEKNAIIDKWNGLGMKTVSAFDTQALLELKSEYCSKKKCLQCKIGQKILQATAMS
ncbi:MAG: DUF2851 family protein [Bacteroidota bacterium]